MKSSLMKRKPTIVEETPEQAADAISNALDFLCGESDAIGMLDVSDLIRRALVKARKHRRRSPNPVRCSRA